MLRERIVRGKYRKYGRNFWIFPLFFLSFYDDISRSLSSCQTPLDNSGLFSALLKFELIGYLGRDFFEAYKEKKKEIGLLNCLHIIELNLKCYFIFFSLPIEVPDILLKRTPFKDNRGNLHTSISHWTNESVLGSPWTQSKRNLSRCS